MVVAAVGHTSLVLDNFRTTLANSATFQSWVGEIDVAGAKNHIHVRAHPTEDLTTSGARPFAVISPGDTRTREPVAGGSRIFFQRLDSVIVIFEAVIAVANVGDHSDAYYEFENIVGAINEELEVLAGADGMVMINGIDETAPPTRAHEDLEPTQGEFYFCAYEYGIGI